MRVFVTGASGWIGSAVVPELLAAGHEVLGLARSDAVGRHGRRARRRGPPRHARRPRRRSAPAPRRPTASSTSATTTTSRRWPRRRELDRRAIETFGDVLAGSGGAARRSPRARSGSAPRPVGDRARPPDPPCTRASRTPRRAGAGRPRRALVGRAVRADRPRARATTASSPCSSSIARRTGVAAYIDDGANRWPAVHRLDAAALVRLAVESAPAGSVLHAVDEQGIPTREIAEAIGRSLGVPARVDPGRAGRRALRLDRRVLRHGRGRLERPDARAARVDADASGPARGPRGGQLRRRPCTLERFSPSLSPRQ